MKETAVLNVSKQTVYTGLSKYTGQLALSGLVILPLQSSTLNITCF